MDFPPPMYNMTTNSSKNTSATTTTTYAKTDLPQQLKFAAHWSSNMYSPQLLNSACSKQLQQQKLQGSSFDESEKIYNAGRMYSTKQSLSVDNMVKETKRDGIWQTLGQSIARSASTILGERFTRNTSSFIKNWTNMNSPLSVTVVSPDLVKSLHSGDKTAGVGFYATEMLNKDSHSTDEILANVLYPNEIVSDSVKKSSSDSSDMDKMWREYKNMYVNCNEVQEKSLKSDKKIVNSVNKTDSKDEKLDTPVDTAVVHPTELDRSANFGNIVSVDDEPVMLEKPTCTQTQQDEEPKEQKQSHNKEPVSQPKTPQEPIAISKIMSNACKKLVNGVENLLQYSSASPESEASSILFTKRACSPKPRRKMNSIMVSRGRGRGKPQLRNSGVSQTRHRKERSRYDQSVEIKSDIDNWEELEYCNSAEDERYDDVDECDFLKPFDDGDLQQYVKHSLSFTLAEVKPKKKPKKCKNSKPWEKLSFSPSSHDSEDDFDVSFEHDKDAFRPRKASECSVDSNDTDFIVFELKDCSESSDYETESDEDTESESEDEDVTSDSEEEHVQTRKVRFNLKPDVRLLLHWKFAHHAARRGPWEQMARDSDRFQGRIKGIGAVLEPVLDSQHRMRIFKERFEEE